MATKETVKETKEPICKKCGKPLEIPATLKFTTGGFRCKCGEDNEVKR